MSTSVKMRERDKARLDRLQAELTARRGTKVSQQDLLAELLALGEASADVLGGTRPQGRDVWALLRTLPVSTGRRTREEDIDRDVYGGRA